ncbi:3649_t:CDS:10 [Diversispora eburnea]|uniref:Mediator of RNA polymerase II transcription subunit 25 n=1 Tax=Diversispora eburnea TaxID=1213867 RepID=A0A9N8WQ09_9GLOM|nr:3649_t:CDS:10 [Diversispora eburnea]
MPQKNIGSPTPECLVVVVLDGTYRLEEHFETLHKAYLEQILKHLKAPYKEQEEKETKIILPVLRCGLVVFGNYEAYSPYPFKSHYFENLTQFEELINETEFTDGGTYENAVSEGLVAALEMFDLHSSQIDPDASQPKKHCILVTNSHPCPDPVHRNMNGKYDEYTFEQITEEMQKQSIHLSLITPEKGFDELENLVKLVNRDVEVHEASDVVKPSHVVKLANFKVTFSQPAEVVTDKKRKREDSTSANDVHNKDQPAPAGSASSSPEINSSPITRLSTVASPINNIPPQGVSTPSAMANHILPQTKIPQQPPHSMPQLPIQQPVPATVRPITATPAMIKSLSQMTPAAQRTMLAALQNNGAQGPGQIFRNPTNQNAQILRLQQELVNQQNLMRRQQQQLSQLGVIRQPIGNFVAPSPPIGSDAQTIFNSPPTASTVGFTTTTTSPVTGFTPTTLGLGTGVPTTNVAQVDHNNIGIRGHMHQKTINALWSGHIAWSANSQGGQKRELSCHVTAFPVPQKKTVPLSLSDYMTNLWPERMEISNTNLVRDLFKDIPKNPSTLVVSFLPTPTTASPENQDTFLILLRLLESRKLAAFIRFPSAPNPNGGLVLFSNGPKIIGVLFMNSPLPTNAPQLQPQRQPQQNQQTQPTPQTQQHAQPMQAQIQAQSQQIAQMQQLIQINPQMPTTILRPQSAAVAQQMLRQRNLQLQSILQTAPNEWVVKIC